MRPDAAEEELGAAAQVVALADSESATRDDGDADAAADSATEAVTVKRRGRLDVEAAQSLSCIDTESAADAPGRWGSTSASKRPLLALPVAGAPTVTLAEAP